jgi:hypothetical protein
MLVKIRIVKFNSQLLCVKTHLTYQCTTTLVEKGIMLIDQVYEGVSNDEFPFLSAPFWKICFAS